MTEPCIAAKIAVIECSTQADCGDIEFEACGPLFREFFSVCDEVECSGFPNEGAESCGWRWECSDGSVEEMVCEGATCACLVDGVQVGECDNDICAEEFEPFGLLDKYDECCG